MASDSDSTENQQDDASAASVDDSANKTSVFDLFGKWKKSGEKDEEKDFFQKYIFKDDNKDDTGSTKEEDEEEAWAEHKGQPKHDEKAESSGWLDFKNLLVSSNDTDEADMNSIINHAKEFASGGDLKETSTTKDLMKLQKEINIVMEQLKKNFGHVGWEEMNPLSLVYYLEVEDSVKTPSWKRRKHRFLPSLEIDQAEVLHDSLYLSELSYVDSVEQIKQGLNAFTGSPFELMYCSIESSPREPAHFVALVKGSANKQDGFFPWQKEKYLDVLMVVRGTKEIGDMISDTLLETSEYKDGIAHDGILHSGKYLVNKHLELFQHLLKESKRDKIRLSLVGHSLGAGAAAIAAMEFNALDEFEATCVGFGCPALLDKSQSENTKDFITTVIADADVIPRMSGATVANMLLDVMSYDFSSNALQDAKETVEMVKEKWPYIPQDKLENVLKWIEDKLDKHVKPSADKIKEERSDVVLFPPGKCIHLFRDGIGVSAVYVPCDFFNEIDVARTMVNDHMVDEGYHRLFLELMRSSKGDWYYQFRNDVIAIGHGNIGKKDDGAETSKD
jgi:hypothetical protein